MTDKFDFNDAPKAIQSEQAISGKNCKSSKSLKTSAGKIQLDTPRDRAGTFEPK